MPRSLVEMKTLMLERENTCSRPSILYYIFLVLFHVSIISENFVVQLQVLATKIFVWKLN